MRKAFPIFANTHTHETKNVDQRDEKWNKNVRDGLNKSERDDIIIMKIERYLKV